MSLRDDAVRLRNCLRNLTDGIGDGYAPLIEEGRHAVIDTGYLDKPVEAKAEAGEADKALLDAMRSETHDAAVAYAEARTSSTEYDRMQAQRVAMPVSKKALIGKDGLDRRPHHLAENAWYYEMPGCIEVHCDPRVGQHIVLNIPLRSIQAYLRRKGRKP